MKFDTRIKTCVITRKLAMCLMVSLCALGCGRGGSGGGGDMTGRMIDQTGTFELAGGSTIRIWKDSNDVLQFSYRDAAGTLVGERMIGGAFSRWFVFPEDADHGWVYSGDIGLYRWSNEPGGMSMPYIAEDDEEQIRAIPDEVFESLSSSKKRAWGKHR